MQLGIVGLPQSGKTTVFNALTRGEAPVAAGSYGQETHVAVVKVPDPRLDVLTEMFSPRKTTPAEVQYTDFPGAGFGSKDRSEAAWVGQLRTVDALLLVVRAFPDESVPHEGPVDPAADAAAVQLETIVSDLSIIERRLQRLESDLRRTRTGERAPLEAEAALLQRFQTELEAGTPLRDLELSEDEARSVRGYQFLSLKPLLIVLNLDENQLAAASALQGAVAAANPHRKMAVASLCGKLEMELAQLEPDDAGVFMADMGIEELAAGRIIRESYDLTGLISFLTAGEDECRAWPVLRGTRAPGAAGAIHTDLEKGFIRAEVVAYADLVECGGLAEARKRGLLRQEGRNYVVQDGDVMNILFSK